MVDRERETVVVDGGGDRRPSYGWLIALVAIVLLIILFFAFGGANLFNGANGGTDTINVDTPENIQVTPTPQQ